MAYHVEVTLRAARDLRRIYQSINAGASDQAATWFNGLETLVFSLEEHPLRGAQIPEHADLRQILYGTKPYVYRIIYAINAPGGVVQVLHIRHGARQNWRLTADARLSRESGLAHVCASHQRDSKKSFCRNGGPVLFPPEKELLPSFPN